MDDMQMDDMHSGCVLKGFMGAFFLSKFSYSHSMVAGGFELMS